MYFLIFGVVEMVFVFAATALFFGMMAGVSLIFKLDLSGIRPLLVGGLLFLILFGLLSMFLNLGSFETVLCYAGIVVFLGFTAYDTTKIRDNYQIFCGSGAASESIGILGVAAVSRFYQPVSVHYPPDEPESEIGKIFQENESSFAGIKKSGICGKLNMQK